MSKYTDGTFLYDFQQSDKVQKEIRNDRYGLIEAVQADTPLYKQLTKSLQTFIETAMNRSFKMPALKESTITTTSAESFTIPANISTSDSVTATLVTTFSGFNWYDALADENQISKEEYVNNKMMEIFKAMALAKESTTFTAIDGQKTQVLPYNPASSDGYTFAGSLLTVTLSAQKERIFSNLQVIAESNGLTGTSKLITSPGIKVLQNYEQMYGALNAMDLINQGFIPAIYTSNRVTNSVRWTGFLSQDGSFAYVNNYKSDFVRGTELFGGSIKWGISDVAMPFINERVMTYYERDKADASALQTNSSQYLMTTVEKFGFIHRYCILTPYNSDITSRINPIIKISGATS